MTDDIIKTLGATEFEVTGPDGKARKFSIADIFEIDETDITHEFIRQPSLYSFFAICMSMAEDRANRADFSKDQEYALADLGTRQELELNGQKFTEAAVSAMVKADKMYTDAVMNELSKRYDYKILKAIVGALEQRANMLISLGSQLRHEESTIGMNVREHKAQEQTRDLKSLLDKKKKQV